MRRDKLNSYIGELAQLVPMIARSAKRMDKTSILRLTATHLRIYQSEFYGNKIFGSFLLFRSIKAQNYKVLKVKKGNFDLRNIESQIKLLLVYFYFSLRKRVKSESLNFKVKNDFQIQIEKFNLKIYEESKFVLHLYSSFNNSANSKSWNCKFFQS